MILPILAYAVMVSICASSIDVFQYMCTLHCTCIKSTFPHTQEKSVMASGGDSGGDNSEAVSSSQITSIRPVTASKRPRSAIWLYFKKFPKAEGMLCCTVCSEVV